MCTEGSAAAVSHRIADAFHGACVQSDGLIVRELALRSDALQSAPIHDAADLPAGHARIRAAAARASPAKESPADIFAGLASDDVQLVLSACQSLREVRTSHVGVSPARDDVSGAM